MGSPYQVQDALVPITIYVDLSDPSSPRVLSEAEETKLDKEKLPNAIKAETAHWRRPNWTLSTLISSNSYTETFDGHQKFDLTRFAMSRVRCLLVDWSLKDGNPELTLEKISPPEMPMINMLSDKSMRLLGTIHAPIIDAFYVRAMKKLYPEKEEPLINKETVGN